MFEPGTRRPKFRRERKVDEIAGHREVIVRMLFQIAHDHVQHIGAVDGSALALPIDVTDCAFTHQLVEARCGKWRKMRIGQMRQEKCHELPINIPARNTSAPPTMT